MYLVVQPLPHLTYIMIYIHVVFNKYIGGRVLESLVPNFWPTLNTPPTPLSMYELEAIYIFDYIHESGDGHLFRACTSKSGCTRGRSTSIPNCRRMKFIKINVHFVYVELNESHSCQSIPD